VWINGCFSTGKTTVAGLLAERIPEVFILDPEVIGATLRDHLVPPPSVPDDFQDIQLWRMFTREAVAAAAHGFDGFVIVPMTVARPDYFEEIIVALTNMVPLDHFTLMATRETILNREASRPDDTGDWAKGTVDTLLPALADPRFAVHIDAEGQTAAQAADEIANRLAVPPA
jgi:hypothetical protein